MNLLLRRILGLPLVALLVPTGCSSTKDRYRLTVDPGSRYAFKYVQDKKTQLWAQLHCEMKVAVARPLPDPISTPETGDLLSFTRFDPGSMGTAGIVPGETEIRGPDRVWTYREVAKGADLQGKSALGVQVSWPRKDEGPRPHDALEVFRIPAIATLEPYVWGPWRGPDEVRGGDFADWERVHGQTSDASPPVEHPFALRCRVVLSDALFIPARADDANLTKPDPTTG